MDLMEIVKPNELNINIKRLKKEVKEYISYRKEYYEYHDSNLEIESIFSEWWVQKVSNGIKIGDGNMSIDIITKDNDGVDVVSVCLNGNMSNEKSIMQNFKESGNLLDLYFNNGEDEKAIELFKTDYITKIRDTINKYELNNIYYSIFISTKTNIYFSCLKINIANIANVKSNGFTKNRKSIYTKNFINSDYGKVTLYKSKKRLELRLNKNILEKSIKLY